MFGLYFYFSPSPSPSLSLSLSVSVPITQSRLPTLNGWMETRLELNGSDGVVVYCI